jgi:hypothetical protein
MEKQEHLDKLKTSFEELKLIFDDPRLFLTDYFNTLKGHVHELNIEDFESIINKINSLETSCLENIPFKRIDLSTIYMNKVFDNTYHNEVTQIIEIIDEKINQNEDTDITLIQELLEKLDFTIKKKIFGNKTLIITDNYESQENKFLLIINDEYFSKNNISPFNKDSLSFEGLKFNYLLKHKLNNMGSTKVLDLNLDINNIQECNLSGININTIEEDCFKDLFKLENLNLSTNHLNIIHENTFNSLFNLNELNLSTNEIITIEIGSFKSMNNLNKLNLSKNALGIINKDHFVNLCHLTELDLSNNKISSIEKLSFQDLKNLEKINLSNNEISILTNDLFAGLVKIYELKLSNNKIDSIEVDTFKSISNLITLDLSFNKLAQLDKGMLDGLNNLVDLILSNNLIDKIGQDSFKSLSRLINLNLDNNQLNHIDSGILKQLMGFSYFKSLSMHKNPMSRTEKTRINLELLKKKHF